MDLLYKVAINVRISIKYTIKNIVDLFWPFLMLYKAYRPARLNKTKNKKLDVASTLRLLTVSKASITTPVRF